MWRAAKPPSKATSKAPKRPEQGSGSAAYVPPIDDLQLIYAEQLLRGEKIDVAFPHDPDEAVINR